MPDDESAKLAEKPHVGAITYPACDLHASVTEPGDVVDLYRRHASVTGHDIKRERVAFDVDIESGSVKTVLTKLGEDRPDGIELERLITVLTDNGVAIGGTLDAVRDLQMSGEIYKPQDDYVLAV